MDGTDRRRVSARLLILGVLGSICTLCFVVLFVQQTDTNNLRVVFFDVGQGDAIFIESPSGKQMLVDGGPDSSVLRALSRELGFFDRNIDVVLATHEDKDHVGGLPEVFRRYHVGMLVRTENQGESMAAHTIDTLSVSEGSVIEYARRDMRIDLGGGVFLTILFPDRDPSLLESNTASIVARLTYGDTDFLLTGDSPQSIEQYLVSSNIDLASDVLKVGHHGSRTSSSWVFLEAVRPQYAIVSAGFQNRYGHPHKEVVDALSAIGATLLNTAEEGSITFESDGVVVTRLE